MNNLAKYLNHFIDYFDKHRKKIIFLSNLIVSASLISIFFQFNNKIEINFETLINKDTYQIYFFGFASYIFLFLSWNIFSKKEKIENNIIKNFILFSYSNIAKYIPGSIGLYVYRLASYDVDKISVKKITKGVLFEQFTPIGLFLVLYSFFSIDYFKEIGLVSFLLIMYFLKSMIILISPLKNYFLYFSSFYLNCVFQIYMIYLFFDFFCGIYAVDNSFDYLLSTYISSFLIGSPAGIGFREGVSLLLISNELCTVINAIIYLRIIYIILDLGLFIIGFTLKRFSK